MIANIWFAVENKLFHNLKITIFTNSLYALTILYHSPKKNGQFLVDSILRLNHLVYTALQNILDNLQWSSAYNKLYIPRTMEGISLALGSAPK